MRDKYTKALIIGAKFIFILLSLCVLYAWSQDTYGELCIGVFYSFMSFITSLLKLPIVTLTK